MSNGKTREERLADLKRELAAAYKNYPPLIQEDPEDILNALDMLGGAPEEPVILDREPTDEDVRRKMFELAGIEPS